MQVSVIIPSYKPDIYILECLKSIKHQTLSKSEYEVIIILNGCNEPYYSNIQSDIKEIFGECDNIHFIQTDSPGVSNARNIGIDKAIGEYIAFIDDDDIVSDTYLEDLLNVSSPTCVGCSNSYAFYSNITEKRENFITKAFRQSINIPFSLYRYRQFLSPPVVKLIHRDIIGNIRFPVSLSKSEDSLFCFMISPRIKQMRLASNSAIYFQRLREGSAMRKKQSLWQIIREHFIIECKYIEIWLKKPVNYNLLFFLSRIAACGKNCMVYIRSIKRDT